MKWRQTYYVKSSNKYSTWNPISEYCGFNTLILSKIEIHTHTQFSRLANLFSGVFNLPFGWMNRTNSFEMACLYLYIISVWINMDMDKYRMEWFRPSITKRTNYGTANENAITSSWKKKKWKHIPNMKDLFIDVHTHVLHGLMCFRLHFPNYRTVFHSCSLKKIHNTSIYLKIFNYCSFLRTHTNICDEKSLFPI